jgi:chorismate synthase
MSGNTFGKHFRLTSFGESHGPAIGGVIDGCPAGLHIDEAFIQKELNRRRPGQSAITTQRDEQDVLEILSGVFEGKSTGAPIAFLVRNNDQRSGDYDALKDINRPSHADYTYNAKYGHRDYRGSGRASARETIARVIGGSIAKLILNQQQIIVRAYVSSVKDIVAQPYTALDLSQVESNIMRCPDQDAAQKMIALVEATKAAGDSVGGTVTCVISGVPAGWGEPVFDKLNAQLAQAMVSINAVKGFEMGDGFSATLRTGSENNDSLNNASNHDGGIQGGISNGKDIWFRVAFKPTSTISKAQQTTDIHGNEVTLEATGRHDPCVLPRAVPIVEAMAALVLVDAWMMGKSARV